MFKPFKVFYSFLLVMAIFVTLLTYILLHPSTKNAAVTFTVNKGEKLNEITAGLEKSGLLQNNLVFRGYLFFRGWSNRVQAGEYDIPAKTNLLMLAEILADGPETPAEKTIIITEGWNNRDIAEYLESLGFGSRRDFLRLVGRTAWQTKYSFFEDKPLGVDIEGYLFPDTYRIYSQSTQQNIVVKMLDNLDTTIIEATEPVPVIAPVV